MVKEGALANPNVGLLFILSISSVDRLPIEEEAAAVAEFFFGPYGAEPCMNATMIDGSLHTIRIGRYLGENDVVANLIGTISAEVREAILLGYKAPVIVGKSQFSNN